jgi:hypothetical protein
MLSTEALKRIDREIAKYPPEQKQSAVMAALIIAQDEKGWLATETLDDVAKVLEMPPVAVYEVATFYNMYNLEPAGKYKLTHRLQRNDARRPLHAEGGRVHGCLRDVARGSGQQQADVRLHVQGTARRADRRAVGRRLRCSITGPTQS